MADFFFLIPKGSCERFRVDVLEGETKDDALKRFRNSRSCAAAPPKADAALNAHRRVVDELNAEARRLKAENVALTRQLKTQQTELKISRESRKEKGFASSIHIAPGTFNAFKNKQQR